jgi:hypothetical protein
MVYICVFDRKSYEFSKKLFTEISEFIDDEYVEERDEDCIAALEEFERSFSEELICKECAPAPSAPIMANQCYPKGSAGDKSLEEYMKSMDKPFAYKLFDWIDERGMTDVECYKKANVDKRIFSKIKSNKNYHPSKQTAVAFAISLQLDLDTTQELLATAGMTLSRSNVFDKIIRYFIHNGNYDIFEINEALFEFDQVLLGSGM